MDNLGDNRKPAGAAGEFSEPYRFKLVSGRDENNSAEEAFAVSTFYAFIVFIPLNKFLWKHKRFILIEESDNGYGATYLTRTEQANSIAFQLEVWDWEGTN